jgi:DNA-binding HxlR family transcriptional regulator
MAAMDFSTMCPKYEQAASLLGKRWTALILRSLLDGPKRFSEITSYVPGLSDRLLSERLQDMEDLGIVERRVLPQRPVVVLYTLTEKGADLRRVVEALQEWANCWVKAPRAGTRRKALAPAR